MSDLSIPTKRPLPSSKRAPSLDSAERQGMRNEYPRCESEVSSCSHMTCRYLGPRRGRGGWMTTGGVKCDWARVL